MSRKPAQSSLASFQPTPPAASGLVPEYQLDLGCGHVSGTGKTLLSRLIHGNSQKPDAQLNKLDCGSLPASVLGQELMGENGAWVQALGGTMYWHNRCVLPAYEWPGNLTELAAVVAHAAVLAGDGAIGIEHLPARLTLLDEKAAS